MRNYEPVPETAGLTPPAPRRAGTDPLIALGNFLAGTVEWLAGRLDTARRRDVESYLAESTDNVDLENRIRRLERGAFFSRYY